MHQLYVHCLRKRSIFSLVLLLLSLVTVVNSAIAARRTIPAITQVQGPSSGNYKKGDKLRFAVTFNTSVKITGITKIPITLANGAHDAVIEAGQPNSPIQYFSYVVGPGDDMSGTVSWSNYIQVMSGLIKDVNSTDYLDIGKYYFPAGPTQVTGVIIDGTPPTVSTFTTNGASNRPNTNASLTFNIVFSEPVTNVTNNGWVATGSNAVTTGGLTIAMNSDKKTGLATFTNVVNTDPAAISTFGLALKAALCGITDLAGNPLEADGSSNVYYLDKAPQQPPVPTITLVAGKTNVNGPFDISISFDKSVSGAFDPTKLSLSNASATFTGTAVGGPYTYTITPNATPAAGTITLQLQANAINGTTGVPSNASNPVTVNYDLQRPTVTITPNVDKAANLFKPVLTFNKPVTGLTVGGLSGTNGTPTLVEISPFDHTTYQVSFTPTALETDITFGVLDNAAYDNFGNGNIANSITYHYDVKPPVVVTVSALTISPTNASTGAFQITFSENVQTPVTSDFAAVMSTGLTGATVTAVTQISPTTYKVEFGSITGDGNLQLQIPAGNNIQDMSGNLLVGPVTGSAVITYDHTAPILTLPTATTYNATFTFVYTFNEPVTLVNPSLITWNNATASAFTQVDATHYQQTVTPSSIGSFSVNVLANSFNDLAGNPLAQAYSFTGNYDNTIPTVTLAGPPSYNSPFDITATLSTAMTPVLTAADFVISNGTINNINQSSTLQYTFQVSPSGPGPISLYLKAGVLTNAFNVSNAQSNTLNWTFDPLPFDITLTAPATAVNTFDVTVNLSKPVSQLTAGNLNISNGSITNIIKVSDQQYTVTVSVAATGPVTITVPANQFTDGVGRPNTQGGPAIVNGVLNHAPTDITLDNSTIAENKPTGTVIGNLTTTDIDAGNNFTYTLSGPDAANFIIVGNQLLSNVIFDYETKSTYQVTIKSTDDYGASYTKSFTITILDVNEAPTDLNISNDAVVETAPLGTVVGTLTSVDPDRNDTHTWSLPTGADNAAFDIVGDQLKTNALFDYSVKNTYIIHVRVTDAGGLSFEKNLTINIIKATQAPTDILLSNNTVKENLAQNTLVGTLSTVALNSAAPFTYTILPGADAANFSINGNELNTAVVFDYETKSSYQITIKVTDANNNTLQKDFTIQILDANDAPTDITLSSTSVNDRSAAGTEVATIAAVDQDINDTHTFTFAGGADDNKFIITNNKLILNVAASYATQPSYTVSLKATDAGGLSVTKTFTITINKVAPVDITLTGNTVPENSAVNTIVGTLSADVSDPAGPNTYSILPGADAANFVITGDKLQTNTVFDYETKNSYTITIRVTDNGGLTFDKVFTIQVTNVNEAPTNISLSNNAVDEGLPVNTLVGTLSATDPDANDTFTYSFDGGADDAAFTITGNQLKTAAVFNYATKNTYNIKIKVTDAGGLSFTKDFVITVNKVNHAPTDIALDNSAVPEESIVGTTVGNLSATDPDANDTFTYSFGGGTDDAQFTISGTQLKTAAVFNYNTKNTYNIKIKVTDAGGLSFTKDFVITVTKVNHAPTDVILDNTSVPEGSIVGTTVGNLSATDPDTGDTFTYSFGGGTDDAQFTISGTQLKTAAVFNYATKNTYNIKIKVTDAGGLSVTKDFVITVTKVNHAPTDVILDNTSVPEGSIVGTTVGNLSATDPDAGDTFTYSFGGGTDDAQFTISGTQLKTAAVFNYNAKNTYNIKIKVTDAGGLSFTKDFVITVTKVNHAPTDISLSNTAVPEGSIVGTTVGNLTATDPDTGDTFTYSFGGGTDDAQFTISGNQLKTAAVFNYSAKNTYNIKIKVTDAGGLSFTKDFVITVTKVNHAPTDISLDKNTVPEGSIVGTTVGNLTATDPDAGETFTYSFGGGTDDAQFTIVGNQLKTAAVFNYVTKNTYSIKIKVTDAGGLSFTKDFTINVTSTNQAPTDITLDKNTILDKAAVGTLIGSFTGTDPDAGETFTWAFAGGPDDAQFKLTGNQLFSNAAINYLQKSSYKIRIRVTDHGGLTFEKDFTINVLFINQPPTIDQVTNQVVCDGHQAQEIKLTGLSAGPEPNQNISIIATSSNDFFESLTTRDNKDGTGAIRYTLKQNISGTTTITVLVRDDGGTANGGVDQKTITFQLLVNELPDVKIVSDKPNPVPAGSIVHLTASGGVSYQWGEAPGIVDGKNTPTLTLKPEASNTYLVTVTNSNGCTVTTDFKLEVSGEVQVEATNLITPNGDGINDRWMVKNISRYPNNEVRIFDRAGRMVYNRRGYANEWDGKLNGHQLAEGTYYYILELGNGQVVKGFITLILQQ
ncbi:cadherin domain-containing protein [Chitinophaga dinghuensis]|nr:cadherin domain-containing protein [Chitinophaga dinghuensis]